MGWMRKTMRWRSNNVLLSSNIVHFSRKHVLCSCHGMEVILCRREVVLDRNAVLCRGKVVLYRMRAVDILEVDDTIRENLMTVLDDIHDRHPILDNLSAIKVLTDNLCPGANIIHGDALYGTMHHLKQQQTIAIVETH